MQKNLKHSLESEKEDKDIFDIIQYGSSVKGNSKPNDIDILVIFLQGTLKERLEKIQNIKNKLDLDNIDIKSILLKEIFSKEFFARSGVILEGISLFDEKNLSEKLGFTSYSLFTYNLKDKTHTQKVKFNYKLSGRNENEGILKLFNGRYLGSGSLIIPINHSLEFEEILKLDKINYTKKNILIQS